MFSWLEKWCFIRSYSGVSTMYYLEQLQERRGAYHHYVSVMHHHEDYRVNQSHLMAADQDGVIKGRRYPEEVVQKYDTLGLELSGGLEYEKMRWQVYAMVECRYGCVPARTLFKDPQIQVRRPDWDDPLGTGRIYPKFCGCHRIESALGQNFAQNSPDADLAVKNCQKIEFSFRIPF